ncbi:MAG: glycosyltransferase family 87 protein [Chitinophagaceae bacterium]
MKHFFLSGKFLFDKKLANILWFGLSITTIIQNLLDIEHRINIYKIFRFSYTHIQNFQNLYLQYPTQHDDVFLYGPTFTAFIAPFAMLPDWLGVTLWVLFNVTILFFAIRQLPIKQVYQNAILILASHEMMNASSWLQYNAVIAACIILGYTFIQKGKDYWALLFIVFATITKIYGVVAFSFFFFSKTKMKFILFSIFWTCVFFVLPILVTSFSFLIQSYHDWAEALFHKTQKNIRLDIQNFFQDISVMGLIRRNINKNFNGDIFVLGVACLLFLSKFIQYKYFKDLRYQLYFLCSVLLFVVIFSTGAESPTYIIAFPACCLWFVLQPPSKIANAFFVFCLIITSFSYSDLLTKYSREFSMQHSLKALPCFALWLVLIYQIFTKQFLKVDIDNGLKIRQIEGS